MYANRYIPIYAQTTNARNLCARIVRYMRQVIPAIFFQECAGMSAQTSSPERADAAGAVASAKCAVSDALAPKAS